MTDEQPVSPGDRVDELLSRWMSHFDRGEDIAAEVLGGAGPELAEEFGRRIDAIRRVEALLVPRGDTPGETTDWAARTADQLPQRESPPVLAGYGPLEWVAEGGMGVVYKALNTALGRTEAVKMIRSPGLATKPHRARFRFEAEAAANLTHPNVVTVYGVGEAAGRPFLAMRWIDGSSLAARPRGTPRDAAALLRKVADAVHYAHQRGILHRDLKPHNILVDAAGEPHVSDFGIARPLDRAATLTEAATPIGTPAYMSPEQTRCEPQLTVASDVFSLGTVLYELLTGQLPFTGPNAFAVMARVRESEPVPPRALNPAVDPELQAVCLKCLEKDPADRYAGAGELADDLARYGRGEPVTAQPPGLWDWLRQLARTRPAPDADYSWPVTAWFGGIVLGLNAVIYALTRTGGSAAGVWLAVLTIAGSTGAVLWWYMLRKFRRLPVTERHSLIIAAGVIVVHLALALAYVPLSASAPATAALGMYPALATACGLGLFVLGSTNWSRFFPIGLGVTALAPVTAWFPDAAPLVYGCSVGVVMWYWSYVKRVTFGRKPPGDCEPQ